MMKTPINHFDREKPFYPLVMNYVVQLAGIRELLVHGLACSDEDHPMHLSATKGREAAINSSEDMKSLLGPLALRSEFQGSPIIVDIEEMAGEFVGNVDYLLPFTLKAAGALLVLAHEMTKDQECRKDNSPLSEFLRHCRNAAGHNGFNFKHNEPRRLAKWGPITLSSDMDQTPLFKGANGEGLLSPGDPIRLLYDIEQNYPSLNL